MPSTGTNADLDRYEFTEQWPSWANSPPDEAVEYVGVIQRDDPNDDEKIWFKPIVRLSGGENRRWVYNKDSGRKPYGPQLYPVIERMLEEALEAKVN